MEEHIALQMEANLRAGMTAMEARRQAVLKFGAVEAVRENYHAEQGLPFLENLLQDLRFALLMLAKSPGFATVAILTTAPPSPDVQFRRDDLKVAQDACPAGDSACMPWALIID